MLHVNIKTGHGESSLPLAVGVSLAVAVDMSGFGDVGRDTTFKSWSYIYVIVVCDNLVFYVYDNTSVIFVQDFNFDPHQSIDYNIKQHLSFDNSVGNYTMEIRQIPTAVNTYRVVPCLDNFHNPYAQPFVTIMPNAPTENLPNIPENTLIPENTPEKAISEARVITPTLSPVVSSGQLGQLWPN